MQVYDVDFLSRTPSQTVQYLPMLLGSDRFTHPLSVLMRYTFPRYTLQDGHQISHSSSFMPSSPLPLGAIHHQLGLALEQDSFDRLLGSRSLQGHQYLHPHQTPQQTVAPFEP